MAMPAVVVRRMWGQILMGNLGVRLFRRSLVLQSSYVTNKPEPGILAGPAHTLELSC